MEILFVLGVALVLFFAAKNILGAFVTNVNPSSTPQQLDEAKSGNNTGCLILLGLVIFGLLAMGGLFTTGWDTNKFERTTGGIMAETQQDFTQTMGGWWERRP